MKSLQLPLNLEQFDKKSAEYNTLRTLENARRTVADLIAEKKYIDARERIVDTLRGLREFPDYEHTEFRAALAALLFDLAELNYERQDYKAAESHLNVLFKLLDTLMARDAERFGPYHIMAMELSTRILRSRKKALDMLARQQMATAQLYDKVNAGVAAATDKLVDSLRKSAQLLSATGEHRAAMKFYSEAIKLGKKRSGKVTLKEVKLTIEMAEIMMRVRSMRPRAERLLNTILKHAIALGAVEMEEDIIALLEIIRIDVASEPKWRMFIHKLSAPLRKATKKA